MASRAGDRGRDGLPVVGVASKAAWEKWLAAEHATSTGVWLRIAKKGAETASVSYADALEIALCYGWIDGQKAPLDDAHWLQRFTPRRPKSRWSKINRDKATVLIEQGRMKPAGLQQVEEARKDGRWDAAYESQSRATVPDDFAKALDEDAAAAAFFATLDRANRYAVLYRIHEAKKPETRAARIEKLVSMLRRREKIHG